jgi:excisionase family DNA binding protein
MKRDRPDTDFLWGARRIAEYLGIPRRQVYHLFERDLLPAQKMGKVILSRKSQLDQLGLGTTNAPAPNGR